MDGGSGKSYSGLPITSILSCCRWCFVAAYGAEEPFCSGTYVAMFVVGTLFVTKYPGEKNPGNSTLAVLGGVVALAVCKIKNNLSCFLVFILNVITKSEKCILTAYSEDDIRHILDLCFIHCFFRKSHGSE